MAGLGLLFWDALTYLWIVCSVGLVWLMDWYSQSVFWLGLDWVVLGVFVWFCAFGMGLDEPESLILAQSERWRHA